MEQLVLSGGIRGSGAAKGISIGSCFYFIVVYCPDDSLLVFTPEFIIHSEAVWDHPEIDFRGPKTV